MGTQTILTSIALFNNTIPHVSQSLCVAIMTFSTHDTQYINKQSKQVQMKNKHEDQLRCSNKHIVRC